MVKSFADKAAGGPFEGRNHKGISPDIRRPALRKLLQLRYALAKAISVSPRRINEIVHGERAITADTALRLGRYFGTDAQSWLNLQSHFDLENAEIELTDRLDEGISPRAG